MELRFDEIVELLNEFLGVFISIFASESAAISGTKPYCYVELFSCPLLSKAGWGVPRADSRGPEQNVWKMYLGAKKRGDVG